MSKQQSGVNNAWDYSKLSVEDYGWHTTERDAVLIRSLKDEIERQAAGLRSLREALYEVACVDIQTLARAALEKDGETRVKLLERIAQYDMQKIAIEALKGGLSSI